ncbi:MAG: winged helix-turn-helix domain-containing protein [Lentisphaeria bacterium]|nr:winged helix-turn-helix domain-containing protein [Lentisphaeria bacterium]
MNGTSEIKVGSKVILKVGRNAVEVEILKAMADGDAYWVKSIASGKEFMMPSARIKVPTVSIEPVAEPETIENEAPNPAPECTTAPGKEKKLSLLDAAVEVLKQSGEPMNTREMVKAATDSGLWIPTDCKTPEQTLYGSIFREMKIKENPRIVKSSVKGKFEYAG